MNDGKCYTPYGFPLFVPLSSAELIFARYGILLLNFCLLSHFGLLWENIDGTMQKKLNI
jgi:hypothetical protein